MKRRDYLRLMSGVVGASVTAGASGCLSSADELGHEDVYLSPPERVPDGVAHPTYGDAVPDVEMYDVFADEYVSTEMDEQFLMTFFFTFCPTECIWLISSMTHAEARILDEGLGEPRVLATTFDPARDTPERMLDYAERMGVDPESGWSLLRPESEERAREVVTDEFGVRYQKTDEGDLYDFIHTTLILLVNEKGYVERTYRNDDPDPDRIADDWQSLVEAHEA
ncbi:MAG: SCO family protein [Halobacteriales archaeon]|nr:SCO family protein [Halobacteriales archaeon]